jgi:carbon-monoxide dehydrogenase medium subunit
METALGAAEVLKGVLLPRLSGKARWSYKKFCRKAGEFAHSIAAVVVDPSLGIANVVVGAIGGKPLRLSMDEKLLRHELAAVVEPSSYEFQLHCTIAKRALAEATQ